MQQRCSNLSEYPESLRKSSQVRILAFAGNLQLPKCSCKVSHFPDKEEVRWFESSIAHSRKIGFAGKTCRLLAGARDT